MKIWCIFKSDTAIKWRELLVVDEPSPLACVAHNIFGESPRSMDGWKQTRSSLGGGRGRGLLALSDALEVNHQN